MALALVIGTVGRTRYRRWIFQTPPRQTMFQPEKPNKAVAQDTGRALRANSNIPELKIPQNASQNAHAGNTRTKPHGNLRPKGQLLRNLSSNVLHPYARSACLIIDCLNLIGALAMQGERRDSLANQ